MTARARYGILIAGLVLLGGLLAVAMLAREGTRQTTTGAGEDEIRTVAVFTGPHQPRPSKPGSLVRVQLKHGQLPAEESPGTVVSDEDCAPDARGVSHCRNRIRLANGEQLEVTHSHEMREVPCLAPGEQVMVRPA